MRIWTPEARAAQRALMQRIKPWTKSTGPRTIEGKARASRNSLKTGLHAKPMQKLRRVIRESRHYLKFLKTNCYEAPKQAGARPAQKPKLATCGQMVLVSGDGPGVLPAGLPF